MVGVQPPRKELTAHLSPRSQCSEFPPCSHPHSPSGEQWPLVEWHTAEGAPITWSGGRSSPQKTVPEWQGRLLARQNNPVGDHNCFQVWIYCLHTEHHLVSRSLVKAALGQNVTYLGCVRWMLSSELQWSMRSTWTNSLCVSRGCFCSGLYAGDRRTWGKQLKTHYGKRRVGNKNLIWRLFTGHLQAPLKLLQIDV